MKMHHAVLAVGLVVLLTTIGMFYMRPAVGAPATTTITLTPDQCVSYVGPVYQLNLQEQLGKGHSVVFPPTPQLSSDEAWAFIQWLVTIAQSGKGMTPLTHAQAFLATCSIEPVGTFVIPALI